MTDPTPALPASASDRALADEAIEEDSLSRWAALDDEDDELFDAPEGVPLAERLRRVMETIGGIEKEGQYSAGNVSYKFRGIEQIAPRVRDAMIEHGVVCVPVRAEHWREDRVAAEGAKVTMTVSVVMTYRFMSCDNRLDAIEAQMVALANDTGDKAVTKALTSAYKYLMLQTFAIADPTDDQDRYSGDEDHDARGDDNATANEEEVATLRAAVGFLNDASKVVLMQWWNTVTMGSLREGRVRAREVPAALALCAALLEAENAAPTGDAEKAL